MTVTISVSDSTPQAGQTVKVIASAVDPDALIQCGDIYWGEGTYVGTAVTLVPRYGRWETPEKQKGTKTMTFSHQYEHAGTYHIQVWFLSGSTCIEPPTNPYGNVGGAKATVTVSAASASPTPSPSPSESVSESPTPSPSAS
jgi:hypothetical protein